MQQVVAQIPLSPFVPQAVAQTPGDENVAQAVRQIPWGHNILIFQNIEDRQKALWYVRKTLENGWSRNVLIPAIPGLLKSSI